jgi:AAA15 family ATPase/GTPase
MIKSLTIQNFQSHENTELTFHRGVNIIVGNSDGGKTACIRALRWVIWNRPSGSEIRSTWGGETRVQLETEEGIIIRSKDRVDKYTLNTSLPRKDIIRKNLTFKAFGTSVPEEISRFLNINEINLQQQLDSPFLLSETSGAVATHWNKVARLDKIDLSTQNTNSWIRTIKQDIDAGTKQQAEWNVELKQFDHLEKFEAEVEILEEMNKRWLSKILNKNSLDKLIRSINHNNILIDNTKPLLELEEPLNKTLGWIDEKEGLKINKENIEENIYDIQEIEKKIEEQKELIIIEIPVNNLLKLYKDKNTLNSQRNLLFKAISSLRSISTRLKTAEAEKAGLQAKFEKVFPSVCPLCGTKIK